MAPEASASTGGVIDLESIRRARDRIRAAVRHTPLQRSDWLSETVGAPIYLKLECWQRTGAFKFRGAYNAVKTASPETRARGLVTASAGNHGLALALAARLLGARATVFVPATAPETKKERIRRAGGALRTVSGIYDDAAAAARAFAEDSGGHFVNAFADPEVVAGQGTVGLELLEDLPEIRNAIVPVGGGGLGAGVGVALATTNARVIGIQSTATTAMFTAFREGGVVPVDDPAETLCEGLAGETEQVAYERARSVMEGIHLVPEARVAPAIRALYRHEGVVAEGSGAVGVAALLAGELHIEGPTAVVISGGNIDAATLAQILAHD